MELTAEQRAFATVVRNAAEAQLRPLGDLAEAQEECPREAFTWAASLGILGINFPSNDGGQDGTKVASVLSTIETARVNSGISGAIMSQSGLSTEAIYRHGTQAQRSKYLPGTFRGELVGAVGITEPDTGSDIAMLAATARRVDGGWILNGEKVFVSNSRLADYFTVAARTIEGDASALSLFVVDRGTPGLEVGPVLKKLGNHSGDTGQLLLSDAHVTDDALIGEAGKGMAYLGESLASARIDYAARSVGVSIRALELALSYAGDRKAFGEPLTELEVTQFKLARMAMLVEVGRTSLLKAADTYDRLGGSDARTIRLACTVKLFTAQAAQEITWEALQIHGAYGYIRGAEVERLFRDARLFTISEGTSEIQHLTLWRQIRRGVDYLDERFD